MVPWAPVLATALLLANAGSGLAGGGGGHGGGGHGGLGGHGGAGHAGFAGHSGHGGHFGHGWGYYGFGGWYFGFGWGYPWYGYGAGYYPGYGGGWDGPPGCYMAGYGPGTGPVVPSPYARAPQSTAEPAEDVARLTINAPVADTEVWLNGVRTKQTGPEQRYQSPPLKPNQAFAYDIRARWTENGQTVERTRTIHVHANDRITVNLARPSLADRAPSATADGIARMTISAPAADAQVWLNGVRTKQTGTHQRYQSPPLDPGQAFAYDIRARWTENGQTVERTRTVLIHANERITVDLARPDVVASK
jgi:uncharacterized protein (TIGR03000 family)